MSAQIKTKIVSIIRADFDQTPKNWNGDDWYDNAEEVADDIIALFSSPAPAAETGWLIELKGVTPSWAIVNPNDYDEHWTTDSTRALRFARKADAEAYIAHIGWTEAFASEHVWDDGRRSGYSDRSTADYLDKRLQEARDRSPDYEKLWAEEAERAEAAEAKCDALREALAAEREACAKVAEDCADMVGRIMAAGWRGNPHMSGDDRNFMHGSQRRKHDDQSLAAAEHVAAAIRARALTQETNDGE